MGYETKLIIGQSGHTDKECARGDLIIEDGEAYRPYLKDENGRLIETGTDETYFSVYAIIDLCKCGSDSEISKIDCWNKDDSRFWYWYDGGEKRVEDHYGDKPKPVPIKTVIAALEKDLKNDDYRRFKWALSLLRGMADEKESITVLFFGH